MIHKKNNLYNNQNYILKDDKKFKDLLNPKKFGDFIVVDSFWNDWWYYLINKKY